MRSVLFLMLPEAGHIFPTLPLARALMANGSQVTYFTSSYFAAHLAGLGFHTASFEAVAPPVQAAPLYECPQNGRSLWYRSLHMVGGSRISGYLSRVVEWLQKEPTHAIALDRALVHSESLIRELRSFAPVIALSTSLLNWGEVLRPGLPPVVTLCSSEFEVEEFRDRGPRHYYSEGPIATEGRDSGAPVDASQGKLVVCSFGTQSAHMRKVDAKLTMLKDVARAFPHIQFVVGTGPIKTIENDRSLAPRPENLDVRPFIPLLSLLKQASLLVTHAGLGSVREAVSMGVPMLALPELFDQPNNAMRVRHLELGEAVFDDKLTVKTVIDGVQHILAQDRYRERILSLRDGWLSKATSDRTCELILSLS